MSSLGSPHVGAQMRRGGLSADSMYNRITNMKSRKDPKEMKPQVFPFDLGEYEDDNSGYLYQPMDELKELISEDSRGNIVRLLKLPKEVADRFHEESVKHSFVLASFFPYYLEAHVKQFALETIRTLNRNASDIKRNDMYYLHTAINDFMEDYGNTIITLFDKKPQLKSKIEDMSLSDIKESEIAAELKEQAIIKFSDGFYWAKLPACLEAKDYGTHKQQYKPRVIRRLETAKMQHCGADTRGDMYSLRDKNDEPHISLTYNDKNRVVYQIKGKQNVPPDKRYWKYITKFSDHFDRPLFNDAEIIKDIPELANLLNYIAEGDIVTLDNELITKIFNKIEPRGTLDRKLYHFRKGTVVYIGSNYDTALEYAKDSNAYFANQTQPYDYDIFYGDENIELPYTVVALWHRGNDNDVAYFIISLKDLVLVERGPKPPAGPNKVWETHLPFDDDEYYDINTHDEYFSPDTNFYTTRTRLRNYRAKTDYEAVSKNPRPTTPGLGTGRATARNRTNFAQTSFPISNKYPGGNIKKMSFKDLRKLVSQEHKR